MTRREMLLELVERLPDDRVDAALAYVSQLTEEESLDSQPTLRPLPDFVGAGEGPADLSERTGDLRSSANVRRLLASIEELEAGRGFRRDLVE